MELIVKQQSVRWIRIEEHMLVTMLQKKTEYNRGVKIQWNFSKHFRKR